MGAGFKLPRPAAGEANCAGEQACQRLPVIPPERRSHQCRLVTPYTTSVDVNCTIATIQVLC